MKNFNKLVVELCKKEGKKVQVNVAQMSEVVKCLFDIAAENPELVAKAVVDHVKKSQK